MPLNKAQLIADLTEAFSVNNIGKDNKVQVIKKIGDAIEAYVKSGDVITTVTNHTTGKGKVQ